MSKYLKVGSENGIWNNHYFGLAAVVVEELVLTLTYDFDFTSYLRLFIILGLTLIIY